MLPRVESAGLGRGLAELDNVGLTFAGTVSPKADEILFTLDDQVTVRFPLVGPAVPGFDQRIFMVHLGQNSLRRIELLKQGERIAEDVRPAEDIRLEDCSKRFDADDAGVPDLHRRHARASDAVGGLALVASP